jgi:hypothetical protein
VEVALPPVVETDVICLARSALTLFVCAYNALGTIQDLEEVSRGCRINIADSVGKLGRRASEVSCHLAGDGEVFDATNGLGDGLTGAIGCTGKHISFQNLHR